MRWLKNNKWSARIIMIQEKTPRLYIEQGINGKNSGRPPYV